MDNSSPDDHRDIYESLDDTFTLIFHSSSSASTAPTRSTTRCDGLKMVGDLHISRSPVIVAMLVKEYVRHREDRASTGKGDVYFVIR